MEFFKPHTDRIISDRWKIEIEVACDVTTLVQESIACPYMDFQNSTFIHVDIRVFMDISL